MGTLVKDIVAPTIAIDATLMTDNIVNDAEKTAVVISGTSDAEDNQTITLVITDGSTTISTTPTVTGGVWTATVNISSLADGNITITANVSDLAGNSAPEAQKIVTKDANPPTLAIDNPLMIDNIVINTEMAAVVISGTSNAEDGQVVALTIGSTPINASATVAGGVWTATVDISTCLLYTSPSPRD